MKVLSYLTKEIYQKALFKYEESLAVWNGFSLQTYSGEIQELMIQILLTCRSKLQNQCYSVLLLLI